MNSPTETPSLTSLYTISYQDENGAIPEFLQGKIGVYAIFDRDQNLQLVAY
ncbi:MAG: Nuclease subunit of the excinuclease complex, partial [Cyanobacteria bacterium QH_8_48_120]